MLDDAAGRRTGIVDHDVDPAERLMALLDEVFRVLVLTQVGGDRDNFATGRLGDFAGSRVQRLLAPCANSDIDAFLRQSQRNPLPDAFAAASDQRGLALELEVHRSLPVFSVACARASGLLQHPQTARAARR